jgi:dinuclear metal center YbgI/SA1388 family protein
MTTIDAVARFLEDFAPLRLAEDWDNVGLLVGDRRRPAQRIMTCLTITPSSAREAIDERADLIVAHHPLPFTALRRLTTDTHEGRLLWELIGAGVSIYSPHTAFDSAREGINQRLAEGLALTEIAPLVASAEIPSGDSGSVGSGRCGRLSQPTTLAALAERVTTFLSIERLQRVGPADQVIRRAAIACGSGGEFLAAAQRADCECMITGEARFHTCLEAEAAGVGLLLAGHYATERFGVEHLAEVLARRFAEASVWASRRERDPLAWS